jgi:hypothetical protein
MMATSDKASKQTWQNVNSKRRLQRIKNVQEGKRHQKKRDIKFVSFQICVVANLSASSCLCLCSFCFWGEVSNS